MGKFYLIYSNITLKYFLLRINNNLKELSMFYRSFCHAEKYISDIILNHNKNYNLSTNISKMPSLFLISYYTQHIRRQNGKNQYTIKHCFEFPQHTFVEIFHSIPEWIKTLIKFNDHIVVAQLKIKKSWHQKKIGENPNHMHSNSPTGIRIIINWVVTITTNDFCDGAFYIVFTKKK